MSEDQPELNPFDDGLAEFTDQMLNQAEANTLPAVSEDAELAALQKVIVQLKQAGLADAPDTKFSARMQAALDKEWQRSGPKPAPAQPSLFQRINDYLQQVFAVQRGWQVALAVAAMLLLAAFFLPQGGAALTGAAGTETVLEPTVLQNGVLRAVEFGLGILCAAVLIWLLLKKKD